ncbi:solute carrier family 22 member 7-like [Pholidichthys leucotaenia]
MYQKLILALMSWARIVLPLHFLQFNFIAYIPQHYCNFNSLDDRSIFKTLTWEEKMTVSIPMDENGKFESCRMFTEPQYQLLSNSSSSANLTTVPCQDGWIYDRSTFTSTIVTKWDLVCGRSYWVKATMSIFFLGVMFGTIFIGMACDRFAITLVPNHAMYEVLKLLTGFFMGGITINTSVLNIEWVDLKHRAFVSMMCSLSWTVGNMMLAGMGYLTRDWAILSLIITVPLVPILMFWWFIPESARWLLASGKVDEAQMYLDKCARKNNRPMVPRAQLKAVADILVQESQAQKHGFTDLFRTPNMRKLSVLTGFVWFSIAIVYYTIAIKLSNLGANIFLLHFLYAAVEIPAKLFVMGVVNKVGRRLCQATTLFGAGLTILINAFIDEELWLVRAGVGIVGKGLSEAAFTTIVIYTSELYPTVIRQTGLGYTNSMCRMGIFFCPVVSMLDNLFPLLCQFTIFTIAIAAGLTTIALRETLKQKLPERIEDVENQGMCNQENLFVGAIPKYMVLGMVHREAFTGRRDLSPFNFIHNNVEYLDSRQIPAKAFQPQFNDQLPAKEFYDMFLSTGRHLKDLPLSINREEFNNRYTLFVFNLAPGDDNNALSTVSNGNLRLEMRFRTALSHTTTLIVYACYDSILEINSKRDGLVDYY